jgi:hypothetical protein
MVKSRRWPPLRIGRRVAEHLEEQGGEYALGDGIRLCALPPQSIRLLQQLHDSPLLRDAGKRNR